MNLKELLGEELMAKVSEALKGKGKDGKDAELGVVNDGSFVPVAKFNEANDAKNAAEKLAKDTAGQLQAIKAAGDPAELAKKLEEAQTAANTQKTDYEQKLKDMTVSAAVKLAVSADAHDPDLVASLLDHTKITVDDKGKPSGYEDQLKALRTDKPFLFKTAEDGKKKDTTITGFTPADGKDQGGPATPKTLAEAVALAMNKTQ